MEIRSPEAGDANARVYDWPGAGPESSIILTVAPSGRASIVDRSKPETYRFSLSAALMSKLRQRIADASVATLDTTYPASGPPIACGTEAQHVTTKGHTIFVAGGPPPTVPAGLERLLGNLLHTVDVHDSLLPTPTHSLRQRCGTGASRY